MRSLLLQGESQRLEVKTGYGEIGAYNQYQIRM
jgi:hypothetical protein